MVRKLKAFDYYIIVHIILDYLKKRPFTAYLLLLQIYKEEFFERGPQKLLNKIAEKYVRKN